MAFAFEWVVRLKRFFSVLQSCEYVFPSFCALSNSHPFSLFFQVSCWGQFDIYGQQLRSLRPSSDSVFSYTAIGKGYFGGVTYCGIYADGDFKGAASCYGRAFPMDTKELTVAEKSDERVVACHARTRGVLGMKQYAMYLFFN